MKRAAAVVKVTILSLVLGLIVIGGLTIYYYTLPPSRTAGSNGASMSESTQLGSSGQYLTIEYNGTSYNVPAKGPNSPTFACPPGTAPGLCTLLQETCGNGVGAGQEPWKSCYNCVFDAGCTGDNSCDPYTHECSAPATACMVAEGYGAN
jgi:hypothetical protein